MGFFTGHLDEIDYEDEEGYVEEEIEEDTDPPILWAYWFPGEENETYIETENLMNVVIELVDMKVEEAGEADSWQVKSLETGDVFTATQILAEHRYLAD